MSSQNQPLDLLRREIDEIDDALHQLIVKRGAVVEQVRAAKSDGGPALRPGREATIMRRLAASHDGGFPLPALMSMWREMISGTTHMQKPLSVAIHAPQGFEAVTRLARDHYGAMAQLLVVPTASACLRAVSERTAQAGVLPLPLDAESNPWWPTLMGNDEKTPKIVSRLPFLFKEGGDQALVVAPWQRDLSDAESSLLAIRLGERTSRGRILGVVGSAGFDGVGAIASSEIDPANCVHLFELDGAIAPDDSRLRTIESEFGDAFIQADIIGGYARPLMPADKTG
jgi:chorismate mutase